MSRTPEGYRDALDFLYARTTGAWKLGLERVAALLALLGHPERDLRCLHVAGTNGKGSVCATLEAVLRGQGLRTAKYTSPHLVDFRERFIVDGAAVEPERIVEFIRRWTPAVERIGATFFEATTAMAFQYFRDAGVDVAVIETGLGGRLDATNVVDPVVAGVTNIGIDHVEYLGATRAAIAAEKAGIFKRGRPAVIGESDPEIAAQLGAAARSAGASEVVQLNTLGQPSEIAVTASGTTFDFIGRRWHTPLVGAHQAANAAHAIAMLRALPDAIRPTDPDIARGLSGVALPGRFQQVGRYLFDVAHNPAGAAVLADTLRSVRPAGPVTALLSVLSDKDWRGVMTALGTVVERFVLTVTPTSPPSRTWRLPEPLAFARRHGWEAVVVRDFDRALALAGDTGGTVLVTGSFHTVGDAMARLEVSPTDG
ncbi:MAG: bifunctional folylpolyglutamate synthase/dihydrofolate synthase [Gemmatimonadetes bacterium]|nr:bifunctional folylpolyglutamate synthase/dihydrofolate synthase [Gemmatimonadota bacterium]